jgi:hypothetical protein
MSFAPIRYKRAITSISTSASLGSRATSTVERAGATTPSGAK